MKSAHSDQIPNASIQQSLSEHHHMTHRPPSHRLLYFSPNGSIFSQLHSLLTYNNIHPPANPTKRHKSFLTTTKPLFSSFVSLQSSSLCKMDSSAPATVQHVNKKSSDELLRKFAALGPEPGEGGPARKALRAVKRRRRSRGVGEGDQCETLGERRWLIPPATRRSALLRRLGARDIRNKSMFSTIQKTWRKTVEGASKVFIDKHYNRHRRLISDAV